MTYRLYALPEDLPTHLLPPSQTFISEASADQRRGRAGRTAPGTCYRLWSADDCLTPTSQPEIQAADLAPVALELALWGSAGGVGLRWLDAPDVDRMKDATALLEYLGAVDEQQRVTAEGAACADG